MRMHETAITDDYGNILIRSYHSLLPKGSRAYREHHHTECELSLFLSGRGIYTVHGRSYEFEAGSVFLFGSNEAHCITEIYEDFNLLNIQFEPRLLWERSETVELLNLFAARSKQFQNQITKDDRELSRLILALEREVTEQRVLQNLRALPDRTCLCITHRPAALAICDRAIRVVDGKIVEE